MVQVKHISLTSKSVMQRLDGSRSSHSVIAVNCFQLSFDSLMNTFGHYIFSQNRRMKKIILSILGADHYLSPGRGGGEGGGGVGGRVEDFGFVKRGFTPGGEGGGRGG